MKKIVSFGIITALLCCMLAGCSKPETVSAVPEESSAAQAVEVGAAPAAETAPAETTAAEKVTEAPEVGPVPATVPEKTASLLSAKVERYFGCAQGSDNRMLYEITYPHVLAEGSDALQASLDKEFEREKAAAATNKNDFTETMKERKDADFYCQSRNETVVARADSSVFSVLSLTTWYGGGAHGELVRTALNYRTSDGKFLTAADVFTDTAELKRILKERLTAAYPDAGFFGLDESFDSYEPDATPEDTEKIRYNFLLTSDGAEFLFNSYELAPYASGQQFVELAFADYPELFNQEVMVSAPSYFMPVVFDEAQKVAGHVVKVSLNQGEAAIKGIVVDEDGSTCEFDTFANTAGGYYVVKEGKLYLYVFEGREDDENIIQIFDLNGAKPEKAGEFEGSLAKEYKQLTAEAPDTAASMTVFEQLTDPDSFVLEKGLKQGKKTAFGISENGMPAEK